MRKNILILNHSYGTQFIDISNQYAEIFDRDEFNVVVVYLTGKPDEKIMELTHGDEVIFLNCEKKSIRGLKISAIKKLLQLCREKKFFLAICHRYKPSYIMLWVAQFCKIPHIIFVMHAMKTITAMGRKLLIASLAKKNMYFAGVSNAVRDDLQKSLWGIPSERVITLYNSIDVANTQAQLLSRQKARKQLGIPEKALIFGTIGRLAPEKDQKAIIYALAKVKRSLPTAKVVIMGMGPLEQELKQLTQRLNLTDDVMFTGFIPQAFRFAPAFDVFLLTSIKEAFGRVLLEAMVAKIPVIGTHVNGIPEVIGDAGIIVPPHQSDMLADAMITILNDKQEWGEKGYQRVEQLFSIASFKKSFQEKIAYNSQPA